MQLESAEFYMSSDAFYRMDKLLDLFIRYPVSFKELFLKKFRASESSHAPHGKCHKYLYILSASDLFRPYEWISIISHPPYCWASDEMTLEQEVVHEDNENVSTKSHDVASAYVGQRFGREAVGIKKK